MTRLPLPAASIITPIKLLALTLRPLRASETSHKYFEASWTSLADAAAFNPGVLTISISRCCMNRMLFKAASTQHVDSARTLSRAIIEIANLGYRKRGFSINLSCLIHYNQ